MPYRLVVQSRRCYVDQITKTEIFRLYYEFMAQQMVEIVDRVSIVTTKLSFVGYFEVGAEESLP